MCHPSKKYLNYETDNNALIAHFTIEYLLVKKALCLSVLGFERFNVGFCNLLTHRVTSTQLCSSLFFVSDYYTLLYILTLTNIVFILVDWKRWNYFIYSRQIENKKMLVILASFFWYRKLSKKMRN